MLGSSNLSSNLFKLFPLLENIGEGLVHVLVEPANRVGPIVMSVLKRYGLPIDELECRFRLTNEGLVHH